MSAQSLQNLEDAIRAHFTATLAEDDGPERQSAIVIDWVIGYTISNIVDVDGENVVGYHNEYAAADSNPNSQAHLAQWVSNQISYTLDPNNDDD